MTNKEYLLKSGSVNYTTTEAQRKVFNVNAKKVITCNTGWVDEGYDTIIEDIMLSERVLLNNVPVKLQTKNFKLQKHLTDKTINYQVQFEYAFNQLNYVT